MVKADISNPDSEGKSRKVKQAAPKAQDTAAAKLQEALKIAEENYYALIEHDADGIVILYSHIITFVNRKMCQMSGYTPEEIIGKVFIDLVAPECHSVVEENYEMNLVEGEANALDIKIVAKDGHNIPVETRARPIVFKGQRASMIVIRDITKRRQAEDALRLSERNFRTSMDVSSIGIRISDNKDTSSYVNQAFMDIFGYKNLDEVKSKPPPEFYTPATYAEYVTRHEKMMRGEPMPNQVDIDIIRKDGTMRNLDVSMKQVFWDGKQQNQTLYSDITERKQTEEALKSSENNFRNSMDSSPIGIRIVDAAWHTLYANQVYLTMGGFKDIADIDSVKPEQLYTPEEYKRFLKRRENAAHGQPEPDVVELEVVRRDGTIRYHQNYRKEVLWNGKKQFMLFQTDITERKRAEAALHESEEKYRLIVENSSDIIFTLNSEGKFLYISSSVKNVLGYSAAELTGRLFYSIIHPDDVKIVQAAIQRNIVDGHQTPGGTEYRVRNSSGEWRWHNGAGNVVRDDTGKFMYFLGLGRDISEIKRLQEETKHTNEQLTALVKKLEEQHRYNTILTEMRDMLQACSKMEETAPIIMGYMLKLFPASQGALFLLSNSRSDLESIVTWGGFPTGADSNVFPPDACWGLRRGRAHVVDDINVGPICPHLHNTTPAPYVCLPLMAKGDILGLLHLKNALSTNGSGHQENADLKQMATTLSEYLSLSIANVKLSESLSRQSIQDAQTGLYNRRFMEESLNREITRASRKQTQIGIIMGDLDHFKKFNDVYGHAAGDKIIAAIGKLFNEKFRGSDIACRYGGEEFLIILPETSLIDTIKRADALREDIKKMEMVFQGQILGTITMSMGVASYPDKGLRTEELLRVADTALYRAKQDGRDRVVAG